MDKMMTSKFRVDDDKQVHDDKQDDDKQVNDDKQDGDKQVQG